MDFSREKLIEIWQRAAPNTPPPELFDTLVYPEEADWASHAVGTDHPSNVTDCDHPSSEADTDQAPSAAEVPPRRASEEATDLAGGMCGKLRVAEQGELALFALYGELARLARQRRQRGIYREFIRLGEDARLAAGRVVSARYLVCGDCPDGEPVTPEVQSLREGIRRAWTLERALVKAYAGLEWEAEELVKLHSAHSLKLRRLLEISL